MNTLYNPSLPSILLEKNQALLEKHKNELIQVVRYWDEDRFVPQEITPITKICIKHFDRAKSGDSYIHDQKKISILNREGDTFQILYQETPYIITITRNNPLEVIDSHWTIKYQGKSYKDLIRSGNTYTHTISQQKKIKEWTHLDMEAGLVSEDERITLLALNYFHDILEKEDGDTVQTKKTEQQKNYEDTLGLKIIEEQPWTPEEKAHMKYIISTKENPNSLFKFYEKMMFIIDACHLYHRKDDYHNGLYLAGFILGRHFTTLLRDIELPNGQIISTSFLPSLRDLLDEYASDIDQLFITIDPTLRDQPWKDLYLKGKEIWEKQLKPSL